MKIKNSAVLARRGLRIAGATFGIAVLPLSLTACSSDDDSSSSGTSSAAEGDQDGGPGGQGGDQGGGGLSGTIASATDGVLQVQSTDEQTTVRYTSDTAISTTVTGSASDITVGKCLVAVVGDDGTATSVTVSDPSADGTCTTGFGGGSGAPGGGGPGGEGSAPSGGSNEMPSGEAPSGDMPSGEAPSDGESPSGNGPGGGMSGSFTVGAVAAVNGSTVTVESSGMPAAADSDDSDSSGSGSADSAGSTEPSTTDVIIGASTTIESTVTGTAADLQTGLCVTAQGTSDDSGGFDATSLSVSTPDDSGECGGRMMGDPQGGSND